MPKIPRYKRTVTIPGTSGGVMPNPEAVAAPYAALTKAGQQFQSLGEQGMKLAIHLNAANAEDQINRVKVEIYKDQAALKDKLMYTTDDFGNKVLRSDYDNFETEAEQFNQQNFEKYRSIAQNPLAWKRVQATVALHQASNMIEARSMAGRLNIAAITGAWTDSIQTYQDLVAKAQSGAEAQELAEQFTENTTNLIRSGVMTADYGYRGIREVAVTGDMRRLYAQIEQNATVWLANKKNDLVSPDNDLKQRFPYLEETDFAKANKHALEVANSERWTKDTALKRLHDENANVVRDMYTAFDQGKMQYKEFIAKTRRMFAPDENGVRKIGRETLEHYEAMAKSKINGDDNIPPNPALYLQLNSRVMDEANPLTQNDLKAYIGRIPPSVVQHFSDKIVMRDIAEGKSDASEEEKRLTKAKQKIVKEENKYIKDALGSNRIEADVLWQLNQDVNDMVEDAFESGQPVDGEKLHEKVQKMVYPIATSWLERLFSDEPGATTKDISEIEYELSTQAQRQAAPVVAPAGPPVVPKGWKRNPAYPDDPTRYLDQNGKPKKWVP
jgi:hypothetical protein